MEEEHSMEEEHPRAAGRAHGSETLLRHGGFGFVWHGFR